MRRGVCWRATYPKVASVAPSKGIHVAQVPIDAAIGNTLEDGSRAHWLGGPSEEDNMADPDQIAETYLHLHRQHRSTWAFEVIVRPWNETW